MKKWSRIILIMILTLTLTACGEKTYTVDFITDGGSYVASQEIKQDGTVTRPTAPTKSGYTFDDWYTANDVKYDFTAKVTEEFTLYAQWIEGTAYVVSFDTDGGSYVDNQNVKENGTAYKPSTPTKEGYTFVRWELNSKEYNFNTPVTGAITLKAVWKESTGGDTTTKKTTTKAGGTTTKKTTTTKKATTTTTKPGGTTTTTTTTTAGTTTPQANVYYYTKTADEGIISQRRITIYLNGSIFTNVDKDADGSRYIYNASMMPIAERTGSSTYFIGYTQDVDASSTYKIKVGGSTYTLVKK